MDNDSSDTDSEVSIATTALFQASDFDKYTDDASLLNPHAKEWRPDIRRIFPALFVCTSVQAYWSSFVHLNRDVFQEWVVLLPPEIFFSLKTGLIRRNKFNHKYNIPGVPNNISIMNFVDKKPILRHLFLNCMNTSRFEIPYFYPKCIIMIIFKGLLTQMTDEEKAMINIYCIASGIQLRFK